MTDEGRFVLDLNIRSKEAGSHWAEFTKSTAFEIRNLLLGTGKMLHIVVFYFPKSLYAWCSGGCRS
jgi:hypothetical protein